MAEFVLRTWKHRQDDRPLAASESLKRLEMPNVTKREEKLSGKTRKGERVTENLFPGQMRTCRCLFGANFKYICCSQGREKVNN